MRPKSVSLPPKAVRELASLTCAFKFFLCFTENLFVLIFFISAESVTVSICHSSAAGSRNSKEGDIGGF